jgi:Ca2+-binding EF-hand superfamily protein
MRPTHAICWSLLWILALALTDLRGQEGEKKDGAREDPPPRTILGPPEEVFRRMDANGDGKVTADEVTDERRKGFFERLVRQADADGDGALSKDEFVKGFAARGRAAGGQPEGEGRRPDAPRRPEGREGERPDAVGLGLFALLDADGDGKLDKEEIALAVAVLQKLDADGDDTVTPREVANAVRRRTEGRPGRTGRPREGDRPREGVGRAEGRGPAAFLRRLDTDGDAKISRDEAKGPVAERFERLDVNKDGFVDRTELEAARGALGPRRPEGEEPRGEPRRPEEPKDEPRREDRKEL